MTSLRSGKGSILTVVSDAWHHLWTTPNSPLTVTVTSFEYNVSPDFSLIILLNTFLLSNSKDCLMIHFLFSFSCFRSEMFRWLGQHFRDEEVESGWLPWGKILCLCQNVRWRNGRPNQEILRVDTERGIVSIILYNNMYYII